MATRRIKDITNTATTFASDDFIALDGATQGTRKMDKDDLISEVSAGVSGDYLEEANNLSDVASLDTSKLNMEIPDVGTAPNEVPLNGQLDSMAYQSAEAVSVAKAQIESTTGTGSTQALTVTDGTDTNFVVQEDGKTGIGTATISNKLTVEPDDNDGILIDSNNDSRTGYLYFGDASSKTVGAVSYDHYSDSLRFNTAGSQRAAIDSSGNVSVGGTTFAAGKLRVEDNNGNHVWLKGRSSDGNSSVSFRNNADSAYNGRIAVDDSTGMNFQVAGSTRATIDTSGQIIQTVPDRTALGTGSRGVQITDGTRNTQLKRTGISYNYGGVVGDGTLIYSYDSIRYHADTNQPHQFFTGGGEPLRITSTALVMGSGVGIDFGSTTTGSGTPSGGLLDDYEEGTFTPVVADDASGGNVGTAGTATGSYTKVGRVVHFSIALGNIDTTGMTAGNTFYIRNLPFVSSTPQAQLPVKTDNVAFNDGIVGSVIDGQSNLILVSLRSGNTDVNRQVSHITSGTADIMLTGTYIAS